MSRPIKAQIMLESSDSHAGRVVNTTTSATEYSNPFSVSEGSVWSAHHVWTGTPTTAVTLWCSNYPSPSLTDDTDWVDVSPATGMPAPAGSASKSFLDIGNSGGAKYRFKYVTTVGSGTIKCWVHGKEV